MKYSYLKSFIGLLSIVLLFASCKSTSKINTQSKEPLTYSSRTASKKIDAIINSATDKIGIKYKYAGTTTSGYDCSGLVYATFSEQDIALPRTSYQQATIGKDLGTNTKKAQKGDLIFFKTNSRSQINHVGIVTEVNDDEIKFVHASTSKGVIISSTKQPYYEKTFVQLNRVIE